MDKAAKAENRIKNVCDSLGITHGGRLWLDTALDPFKDIVQKPIGYPDRIMTPSVVQTIHDSVTIKAPGSDNWDCNIFLDHVWKKTQLYQTLYTIGTAKCLGFNQAGQGVQPRIRGGMIVRKATSGSSLGIDTTDNNSCLGYQTDVFDNDTSARIIGIGLEVHNTTAEIQKQGAVCCYRVSDLPDKTVTTPFVDFTTVKNSIPSPSLELVDPPYLLGQAMDLPGSIQWDAEKGVYIVPTFIDEENKPDDLRPMTIVNVDTESTYPWVPLIVTDSNTVSFKGDTNLDSCENTQIPISLSGAFFTGLSPQTTLVANLTYYVEQFPSFGSPMHRISSPSCPEDFAALELYSKVARVMPTGVEVNDNFLGSFVQGLANVMRTVARVAPTVARVARGIGTASNVVSSIVGGLNEDLDTGIRLGASRDVVVPHNSTNHDRTIVVHQPPRNSPKPETTQIINTNRNNNNNNVPNRSLVVYEPRNENRRNNNNNGPRGITVKNKRDKNYNRLDRYIKAGNAGNRYIQ
jgi:hypothetical protein